MNTDLFSNDSGKSVLVQSPYSILNFESGIWNQAKRAFAIAFLLLSAFIFAGAERRERLIQSWQPVHFDVNLTFNDSLSEISFAKTEVTVLVRQPDVTVIDFDFGVMPIASVKVDGQEAKFVQREKKLDVYLVQPARANQQLKVSIAYSGKPQDGLILRNDKDGNPSAVGDNWPDRVHNWIPCLDHPSAKASVTFTVTASSRNVVVATGALQSETTNRDATKTWIWKEQTPISPYNMVAVVGQFATGPLRQKSLTPISYYVSHSERQFASQGFSPAAPSVNLFSRQIAPYPYEKLALIVGATRFGGMENANTIVFTPNLFKDFDTARPRSLRYQIPSNTVELVAHEVAHQWFGNTVTQATWSDLWLSEGFATYFAGLFLENNESKEVFRAYMRRAAQTYLASKNLHSIPIHDSETNNLFQLLNANNYQKGAWVLHILRGRLGDKAFFEGLKNYYKKHRNATATSEDLRVALEKASNVALKDFFDRWVYKAGHPIYKLSWEWKDTNKKRGSLEITLKQVQEGEAFLTPVAIEVVTNKISNRVTIVPTGKETTIKVRSLKPGKLVLDPDEIILKEIASN